MLHALIVLYNKRCVDSLSLRSLENSSKRPEIDIIIFDNSTTESSNEQYCSNHNITYYGFKKNLGLSKAYNYVIDRLDDDTGYLMILDDDTMITDEYIDEVFSIIKIGSADEVLLPIVIAGDFILSPSNVKYKCGARVVKNISQIEMNKITAINSGMVVGLKIYKKIRYNENLFLDCVDHDFMYEVRNNGYIIIILSSCIIQNYSRNSISNIESAKMRFEIYQKDFYNYSKDHKGLVFYQFSILKHAVKQCLKYNNLWFLKNIIRMNSIPESK